MNTTRFAARVLALLLVLCTIGGLLPNVAVLETKAAEVAEANSTVADETASLVTSLTSSYNSLVIPINQRKTITTSNQGALDGTYFILVGSTSSGYRTINFSSDKQSATLRMTANTTSDSPKAAITGYYFPSVPAVLSGSAVSTINGKTPTDLSFAIELQKNTTAIKKDTTTTDSGSGTKGWQGYLDWEWTRSNNWSNSTQYGTYLFIKAKPTANNNTAYNMKSLHPDRASNPYMGYTNTNGQMEYTSTRKPFFLIPNFGSSSATSTDSTKIYKMDYTGGSIYNYFMGWDRNKSKHHIYGATMSQIVREDKNSSEKWTKLNLEDFLMNWELYQISPLSLELYKALTEVKALVAGGNAEGQYTPETYLNFLKYVEASMAKYNQHRNTYSENTTDSNRIAMDAMARDLRTYKEVLLNEQVEPLQIVLDYGKAVKFTESEFVAEMSFCSSLTNIKMVGIRKDGSHNVASVDLIAEPDVTTEGGSFSTSNGIFDTDSGCYRYTPTGFMDAVETVYGIFTGTYASQGTDWYLEAAIEILPANMVYYEAEGFAQEFTLTKKTTDQANVVTVQSQWESDNYKSEGIYTDTPQDLNVNGEEILYRDYTNNPDVLFFGFDNTAKDVERYTNASNGYGGYNYDDPAEVDTYWKGNEGIKIQDIVIDQTEGAMKITAMPECKGSDPTNVKEYHPDAFVDTIYGGVYSNRPLSYDPKNAEIYQVRFKMKNFRIGTDINEAEVEPYVNLQYQTVASAAIDDTFYISNTWELSYNHIHSYVLDGDQYVVMTLYSSDAFRNSGTVNKIRPYFGGIESISASQLGEVYIDYIYIGPYDLAPVAPSYGRDSSYMRDNLLSNGRSLYVEGNGVRTQSTPNPANYTEINFTFTGTGFDLITRTNKDQGTFRVEVYKDEDRTEAVKTMSVNTKGELELYQIPTVSIQDLEHGKYYVSLMVNEANTTAPLEFLRRGNQLYLDAIRIYDPIDVSQGAASAEEDAQSAFAAYCSDGEAYPVIREVRELLLSAKDFNQLDGTSTSGMVYVDYAEEPTETVPVTDANGETTGEYVPVAPDLSIDNHVTKVISTYDKVGPNNEVYLSVGQSIAFKFVVYSEQIPSRLDIGCKIIDGNYARIHTRVAKSSGDVRQALFLPIYSATAQYYSLPLWEARFTEGTDKNGVPMCYIYVVIENFKAANNAENTTGILSITDLKVAYDQKPTLPAGIVTPASYDVPVAKKTGTGDIELPVDSFVDFVVDGELAEIAKDCTYDQNVGTCDHSHSYWVTVLEPAPGQAGIRHLQCPQCGEILESETLAAASELTFAGASVSLQSDLAINYKVNESFFTELGYSDPYVVIEDNGTEVTLREYEVKDGKYVFVYKNIAPHRIGDTVMATLYATYGTELYCSPVREYSVADYCYNMLGKTEGNAAYDELRTLLVDILLYGAETQAYMSYRLDSLCTARLTEAQLACGTAACRELVTHKNQTYEVIDNPTVHWKGAGLNLRESVAIRFKLEAESYQDLEVRITVAGKTYSIYAKDFDHRTDGTYVHFKTINAAQMSEPVYAAVYRNGEQVSHTICYSIESYAYSKQNDTTVPHLADLVKRMMCYGDSCKAYVD